MKTWGFGSLELGDFKLLVKTGLAMRGAIILIYLGIKDTFIILFRLYILKIDDASSTTDTNKIYTTPFTELPQHLENGRCIWD